MKHEISKLCLSFCSNGCILTEGGTDKNQPGKNLPDKEPPNKPPDKKPRRTRQIPCNDICMYACNTKIGVRDVGRTLGRGPEIYEKVWQVVQNWSKIAWRILWTAP